MLIANPSWKGRLLFSLAPAALNAHHIPLPSANNLQQHQLLLREHPPSFHPVSKFLKSFPSSASPSTSPVCVLEFSRGFIVT